MEGQQARIDDPRLKTRLRPAASLPAVLIALIPALLASCATLKAGLKAIEYPVSARLLPDATAKVDWLLAYRGVSLARFQRESPPLAVFAARIDLRAPGIRVAVTDSNGERPLATDARTTAEFVRERNLELAINATPFAPVNDVESSPRRIDGLSADAGNIYSLPAPDRGCIIFGPDNRAKILPGRTMIDLMRAGALGGSDVTEGVGGYGIVLADGRITGTTDRRDPRTAVGVSADGWVLYLMVIDGRQLAWSVGATTYEVGAWLRFLGASDGLNLDGGGSSALVAALPASTNPAAPPVSRVDAVVLNSPIDHLVPGLLRLVGNNLGIDAQPLPGGATRNSLRAIAAVWPKEE